MSEFLRLLPSITAVPNASPLKESPHEHAVLVAAARRAVDEFRQSILAVAPSETRCDPPTAETVSARAAAILAEEDGWSLRPVINATGILLHTNLGRSPLAAEALAAIQEIGKGYCSLELDVESGERTRRTRAVERLLCELTGAEGAWVANNNAGAAGIVIATLAAGRETIVSHGQLIEIGGGFRLPDVIRQFGGKLVAVGTTNRTYVDDYAAAIGEQTALLFAAHASNYRIIGFTAEPELRELAELGRARGLPLVHDIGSGALLDMRQFGCGAEPTVQESLRAGADLVLFSGDKLLGGPQCGILVGRKDLLAKIAANPLSRALRVDKFTLAALEATLELYRDPRRAIASIPLLRFLATDSETLRRRCETLRQRLAERSITPDTITAETIQDVAYAGGGSLPETGIPSWGVAIAAEAFRADDLARRLRTGKPAVMGRIQHARVVLNLHGVTDEETHQIAAAIEIAVQTASRGR